MYGDTVSVNHAEHTVSVQPTVKTKLIKTALVFGAVGIFVLLFVVLSVLGMQFILLPSAVMVIVLEVFAVWFFWKYTSTDYDYSISAGDLSMAVVYGGRTRKELFKTKISSAELIADYGGVPSPDERRAEKVYNCLSEADAQNAVYMLFKDESGKKCIVYFETTAKVLKLLKFYNASAYKVTVK